MKKSLEKFTKNNIFKMLAVDQRNSFKRMLKQSNKRVTPALVKKVKKEIITTLAPHATAVLIDPIYCKDFVKDIKKHCSVLFCLEDSDLKKTKKGYITRLQKGFSVNKAKKLGADAVKLNLYYNPFTDKSILKKQQDLVKKVKKECKKNKLPFLLEIIVYPFNQSEFEFAIQKPLLVVNSFDEFSKKKYGVDILKLQFPCEFDFIKEYRKKGNLPVYKKDSCIKMCDIISMVDFPWVLLSAGADMKEFEKKLKMAVKGGCDGFLAGRAIWKDALKFSSDDKRIKWIRTKGIRNFKKISKIVEGKR